MAFSVIRLGFEPKTHSLEGCCSIQLSYRTDPYLLLDSEGLRSKVAAKIVIIFGFAIWRVYFLMRILVREASVPKKLFCFPACDELADDFDACHEEETYESENDSRFYHRVDMVDIFGDCSVVYLSGSFLAEA